MQTLNDVTFRKSPRLQGFDYGAVNYYFVTICTHEKRCIFYSHGQLNHYGRIACKCLEEIPSHFPGYRLDKFVVMPNHVHAILAIQEEGACDLPAVIGQYKSAVTKRIHERDSEIKVWQRSFHDHVIRNQHRYELI